MATARGVIEKTPLDEFSNPRKAGIIALNLTMATTSSAAR